MTEPRNTFDVSLSVTSNNGDGRAYMVEQQHVPPGKGTAIALATCLRAMMGQLHPDMPVEIDAAVMEDDEQGFPLGQMAPAAHEQIMAALAIMKAWIDREEAYATLTAEQVREVAAALTAADALAHVVAGQGVTLVSRISREARVLLGELAGVPQYWHGRLDPDGDRPDGSLMITLDPAFTESQLEHLRDGRHMRDLLDDLLRTLLRLDDSDNAADRCRVCGTSMPPAPEGGRSPVGVATWALHHFRDAGCWKPVMQWSPENRYVPVTMIRPGDEVRVEFMQNDGTFVEDPLNNGGKLDHGYVTGTVVMTGTGEYVLDDDDRTTLQAKDDDQRMRRIFLIRRGEWSSAIYQTQEMKRERNAFVREVGGAVGVCDSSFPDEVVNAVHLLRTEAVDRRVYLSRIATALGLPELPRGVAAGVVVETVRGILSRLKPAESPGYLAELHNLVVGVANRPGMPPALRELDSSTEVVTALANTVQSVRAVALSDVNLPEHERVVWRVMAMARTVGLFAREGDGTVEISVEPFPEGTATGE